LRTIRSAGFLPAVLGDLASDRGLEPGQTQLSGAGQVAAVTIDDHRHRRSPGTGLERLLRGLQRCRPDTLEQCTDLLDLADHVDHQLLATRPEMTQPAPRLIDRFRDIAAQFGREPRDQHRVLLIGLVERQILSAPRVGAQRRLNTHERHTPISGQLTQHPPPVTGGFAGDRHAGEVLPRVSRGLAGGPVQRGTEIPRPTPERLAGDHLRVVIAHDNHLFLVRQIDPDDRVRDRHQRT